MDDSIVVDENVSELYTSPVACSTGLVYNSDRMVDATSEERRLYRCAHNSYGHGSHNIDSHFLICNSTHLFERRIPDIPITHSKLIQPIRPPTCLDNLLYFLALEGFILVGSHGVVFDGRPHGSEERVKMSI